MPTIENINDERLFKLYLQMRGLPLGDLNTSVHPNIHNADKHYDELLIALTGGNDTIADMSSYAAYHASIAARVAPFIAAIRAGMDTVNDTMHITNVLAVMSGQERIFSIDDEEITPAEYIQKLQAAIATLNSTIAIVQQLAGGQ